ncbi:hypothetical protein EHM76_04485, partial [bacterium]
MSTTKLALITILEFRGRPDNTLPGGPPPRPDQGLPGGGAHPSHPIHIPSPPDVIWPHVTPPDVHEHNNTL